MSYVFYIYDFFIYIPTCLLILFATMLTVGFFFLWIIGTLFFMDLQFFLGQVPNYKVYICVQGWTVYKIN